MKIFLWFTIFRPRIALIYTNRDFALIERGAMLLFAWSKSNQKTKRHPGRDMSRPYIPPYGAGQRTWDSEGRSREEKLVDTRGLHKSESSENEDGSGRDILERWR